MIPINVINSFYYSEARQLNNAVINHLSNLMFEFENKKILETGCGGVGDITQFLLTKNADVTLNDFRIENIESLMININKKLPFNNWDLNEIVNDQIVFDIIICYGTLYHLYNLENAFQNLSKLCKEFTIINTCTSGKNDNEPNIVFEGKGNEQSSNEYGSRPGRLFIWNELKKNFKYVYCTKTQPDYIEFPISFPSNHHASRNVFIGSHIELNNNNLIDTLINNYMDNYMDNYLKNIPDNITHIKIDIGLSYNAPQSNNWLSNEENLLVFGFEPNPDSVQNILQKNIVKRDPCHGEPLRNEFIDNSKFRLIPVALNNVTEPTSGIFYSMANDTGTSSLYKPVNQYVDPIKTIINVPIYSLKHFFDLFPWDRFEYIDYIKIDAQGADFDIIKSAGDYLKDKVVFITAEPESKQYSGCDHNTTENMVEYLKTQNFHYIHHPNTQDPTFLNDKFKHLYDKIYIKQF